MFRLQSNSKLFVMATLVILLCLVCLTGATLALFTSDPNDGTIGIVTTSGDMAVDIVDADTKETLVNKVLQFQTTAENSEVIFEPGAVFFTQGFKIENEGNIPINFRLYVSEDEKIDMTEFHRAFEVWISTSKTRINDATEIKDFTGSLGVDAFTDETYYLIVKMKENAGNEFQGKTYEGIGVTVYAVQGNSEIK